MNRGSPFRISCFFMREQWLNLPAGRTSRRRRTERTLGTLEPLLKIGFYLISNIVKLREDRFNLLKRQLAAFASVNS